MRKLIYFVASTLDGFIARGDGSFADFPWSEDYLAALLEAFPETFPARFRPGAPTRTGNRLFDAVLMGRKTYEVGLAEGIASPYPTLDDRGERCRQARSRVAGRTRAGPRHRQPDTRRAGTVIVTG
jgi:dihydrofolate reductase